MSEKTPDHLKIHDWNGDGPCEVCGRTANTLTLDCITQVITNDPLHRHTLCTECDTALSPGDVVWPKCPTTMTDADRALIALRNES